MREITLKINIYYKSLVKYFFLCIISNEAIPHLPPLTTQHVCDVTERACEQAVIQYSRQKVPTQFILTVSSAALIMIKTWCTFFGCGYSWNTETSVSCARSHAPCSCSVMWRWPVLLWMSWWSFEWIGLTCWLMVERLGWLSVLRFAPPCSGKKILQLCCSALVFGHMLCSDNQDLFLLHDSIMGWTYASDCSDFLLLARY